MPRLYDSRKRVLVTGGAGFLGSHLIDRLLENGHEVLCVDNLFTGTKRNIEHLHGQPRFEFIRHDVTFPLYLEVDEIYNLACPASPSSLSARPRTDHQNLGAWRNQYAWAGKAAEVPHSASINQRSLWRSFSSPANGRVLGKRQSYWTRGLVMMRANAALRPYFLTITASTGLEIKVARIFNTYGPRMHPADGRVVSNFIVQALKRQPITLYGDGKQTRSFCYVDDP